MKVQPYRLIDCKFDKLLGVNEENFIYCWDTDTGDLTSKCQEVLIISL